MQVYCAGIEELPADDDAGEALAESAQRKILELEAQFGVPVIALTTGTSAGCCKGRRLVAEWRPSLITMNCLAHMVRGLWI